MNTIQILMMLCFIKISEIGMKDMVCTFIAIKNKISIVTDFQAANEKLHCEGLDLHKLLACGYCRHQKTF